MTSSHGSHAEPCTFHTWLDGERLKGWDMEMGLQRVWKYWVRWGFFFSQSKGILLLPDLSVTVIHPSLTWIISLPSACFSPFPCSPFWGCEDLREIEGECPRGWWLHLYAVTQAYWTELGIGLPRGFVVTHILPIDCVEAAGAGDFFFFFSPSLSLSLPPCVWLCL